MDVRVARQSVPKRETTISISHVIIIISGHGIQDDLDSAMYKALTLTDPALKTFSQKLAKMSSGKTIKPNFNRLTIYKLSSSKRQEGKWD